MATKLPEDFESSDPTELLDSDTFPSHRLLALAFKIQSFKELRWIPWKFRLSSRAQDDHLLLRPKKVPRLSELSDLLLDDAPTREIHSGPVSHNLLSQLLSLNAVALSLVKACHLGSLKIYNRKFVRLCFPRFEADSGLRGPSVEEAQQADKRAWEVISDLCNLHQSSLDNAIYEGTEVRSELASLLAPRPVAPKFPPSPHPGLPPRGRGRGGKGRGKEGRGKSTSGKGQGSQKTSSVPGGKWLRALYESGQRKTICMRFQTEEWVSRVATPIVNIFTSAQCPRRKGAPVRANTQLATQLAAANPLRRQAIQPARSNRLPSRYFVLLRQCSCSSAGPSQAPFVCCSDRFGCGQLAF